MGKHESAPLSNTTYDFLKLQAQVIVPALGTLYFTLAQIWGLPKAEEVVGTIMAIDAFLGLILKYSSIKYNNSDAKYDGVMNVTPEKNSLVLNEDIPILEAKKDLVFKVVRNPNEGDVE